MSAMLSRWKRYGFPLEIYYTHPDFAKFLLATPLGSQIRVTGDPICVERGVPKILVEGEWHSFEEISQRFCVRSCKRYRQKFIYDRETNSVFTYLGGGKGLVEHHPYKSHLALKTVSEEEYVKARSLAKKFNGCDEEAILQIVSTNAPGKHRYFSARHIYLRFIDAGRNLYSMGFGYDDPIRIPLKSGRGLLRSPDFWEYKRAKARTVTNIPLSKSGVRRLIHFAEQCQKSESYAFHILHHNCAAFVSAAVKFATGLNIPTRVRLRDFLSKLVPRWVRIPGKIFLGFFGAICTSFIAFGSLLLGEGSGRGGRKFGSLKKRELFASPVFNLDYWFDFSTLSWHDPLVATQWQLKQPSTQVLAQ
ncbi:MAG: hypothetical protein SNF33_07780 [Candidatus Algichlamydia australiensis]|nr:hypothetical protein [Chlamydiales bacterium]